MEPIFTSFATLPQNELVRSFYENIDNHEDILREVEGNLPFLKILMLKPRNNPDARRKRVAGITSRLGLVVLNPGTTTTPRQPGHFETISDISFPQKV